MFCVGLKVCENDVHTLAACERIDLRHEYSTIVGQLFEQFIFGNVKQKLRLKGALVLLEMPAVIRALTFDTLITRRRKAGPPYGP